MVGGARSDARTAFLDLNEAWFNALAEGWATDPAERIRIDAALRHSMDYGTWQSLTMNGLSADEAAEAMTAFISLMAAGFTSCNPVPGQ
jgi:hypothetical protein